MSTSLEEGLATAKDRAIRLECRLNRLQNQLRLQFAGEAMNGLVSEYGTIEYLVGPEEAAAIAKAAFMVADAMLEEAKK